MPPARLEPVLGEAVDTDTLDALVTADTDFRISFTVEGDRVHIGGPTVRVASAGAASPELTHACWRALHGLCTAAYRL